MENFIHRIRSRFSSNEHNDDDIPVAKEDGEISPTKKIGNVEGERKKAENWFGKHFSGKARSDYDSTDEGDFATVLGAAAFAVVSLEEAEYQNKIKTREKADSTVVNNENRSENGRAKAKLPTTRSHSQLSSDNKAEDTRSPGKDSTKTLGGEEHKVPRTVTNQKLQGKAEAIRVPTTKEIREEYIPRKELDAREVTKTSSVSVSSPDATVTDDDDKGKKRSPTPGSKESKADQWKQIEIKKIKERYEKVMALTLSWENEKKAQAKRHLARRERSIDKKRAKSLEHYRLDMMTIEKVAGKVRTHAENRRQKEELKANEEAKHIRLTGKAHSSCFCF